jgi:hypothetical protein
MYTSGGRLQLIISRYNYDIAKTFDVLVGEEPKQQRFTVYHDLLAQRSEFMRAARSERWNTDPTKPTILDDHKPQVFPAYLMCVNFGAEALEEHVDALTTFWDVSDHDSDDDDENDRENNSHDASVNDNHDEETKGDNNGNTEIDDDTHDASVNEDHDEDTKDDKEDNTEIISRSRLTSLSLPPISKTNSSWTYTSAAMRA